MKYGIYYKHYNDIAFLLYCLQEYDHKIIENQKFTFSAGEDEFLFTNTYEDLLKCDKKILACITNWNKFPNLKFDKIICSFPGESPQANLTDKMLVEFLDKGNICISSCNLNVSHKNLIFDYSFNLVYLYYFQGYNYVNIHDFKNEKTNLLGLYSTATHVSGNPIAVRIDVYNRLKSILGDDLHVYPKKANKLFRILEPYGQMGLWERNFASTYTDFATSACSMIFETNPFKQGEPIREHSTEKTLKCVIFSEANIFTCWYGSMNQYHDLKKKGIWFLNFDYINEASNDIANVRESIYSAVEFLKQLKQELGTDTKVHQYLVEKYGHKLRKNTEVFNTILAKCEHTTRLLESIKG